MFCSKAPQNKINQIQKRALRIVYRKPNSNLNKLVELGESTVLTSTLKTIILLTEVCRTTRAENPIYINKIFTETKQYYNLHITNLNYPKVIGSKYWTITFGSLLPIFEIMYKKWTL